jgi:hypothetical protein
VRQFVPAKTKGPAGLWRLASLSEDKEPFMKKFVSRFIQDQSGATAIEYGLIVALIAVVQRSKGTKRSPSRGGPSGRPVKTFGSLSAMMVGPPSKASLRP